MRDNPLKTRLAAGEVVFGTMVFEFDSPGLARIVAAAGAAFIILDMEHSGWGVETIKRQIAFARGAGLVAVVNPPSDAREFIGRPLDLGADGLMIPVVETAAQAEAIVAATRYPPLGTRGSAFGIAHDDYAAGDVAATMAAANEHILVIVKIETAKGVANADAILGVPGIDIGFVGHTDLSASLGIPGQFAHPDLIAARAAVVDCCRKHGKAAGRPCHDAGSRPGVDRRRFLHGDVSWRHLAARPGAEIRYRRDAPVSMTVRANLTDVRIS
jgi:2-keto-3-deoxy-L-rhamnonate aldolase RhmA